MLLKAPEGKHFHTVVAYGPYNTLTLQSDGLLSALAFAVEAYELDDGRTAESVVITVNDNQDV